MRECGGGHMFEVGARVKGEKVGDGWESEGGGARLLWEGEHNFEVGE